MSDGKKLLTYGTVTFTDAVLSDGAHGLEWNTVNTLVNLDINNMTLVNDYVIDVARGSFWLGGTDEGFKLDVSDFYTAMNKRAFSGKD